MTSHRTPHKISQTERTYRFTEIPSSFDAEYTKHHIFFTISLPQSLSRTVTECLKLEELLILLFFYSSLTWLALLECAHNSPKDQLILIIPVLWRWSNCDSRLRYSSKLSRQSQKWLLLCIACIHYFSSFAKCTFSLVDRRRPKQKFQKPLTAHQQ